MNELESLLDSFRRAAHDNARGMLLFEATRLKRELTEEELVKIAVSASQFAYLVERECDMLMQAAAEVMMEKKPEMDTSSAMSREEIEKLVREGINNPGGGA